MNDADKTTDTISSEDRPLLSPAMAEFQAIGRMNRRGQIPPRVVCEPTPDVIAGIDARLAAMRDAKVRQLENLTTKDQSLDQADVEAKATPTP